MPHTAPISMDSTGQSPAVLAQALAQATQSGQPLDAAAWPAQWPESAVLAVHQERARLWGDGACAPQFWKSGGPSRQQPLSHAPLPPLGVLTTGSDLRQLPLSMRGVEAEIALRVGRDVDAAMAASLDGASAAALIDAMAVSIEVVDSRWAQQLQAPDALKAADLLCHGALVSGAWQPYRAVDWAAQHCTVQLGQRPAATWQGSYSLQDPAWLLASWLRYATTHFGVVRAGAVVTTGSWCGLLLAEAGESVQVRFDGIDTVDVLL